MQNNDFDKGIRDMLNNFSPEFNPADWARMENMLGQIPAAGQSTANTGGSAGKPAGAATSGVKIWIAVAAVVVSGITGSVLYFISEKQAVSTEKVVIKEDSTKNNSNFTQLDNGSVNIGTTTEPSTGHKNIEKANAELEPASKMLGGQTNSILGGNSKAKATGFNAVTGEMRGREESQSDINNSISGSFGANQNTPFPQTTFNKFSGGANNSNSSGQGNTAAGLSAIPCLSSELPYLPYLVAGLDTTTVFEFSLSPCEPFCLLLPSKSVINGAKIKITGGVDELKENDLVLTSEVKNAASFCWTPSANHARNEPYVLKVSLQDENCPEAKTYNILLKVGPQKLVKITGDSVIVSGQQTKLSAKSRLEEAKYNWQSSDGQLDLGKAKEIFVSPSKTTLYSATVTTAGGCQVSATYKVKVEDATVTSSIFVPNIFSPNGDGVNDRFEIKTISPGDMTLEVSNRYGKMVYTSNSYRNNWDGNGLPSGVYWYTIKQKSTGKILKGMVEISR